MMAPSKPLDQPQAYAKAEAYCARAERCSWDVRRKLYDWGVERSLHDAIIDRLIDKNFIDEARFALSFARDKHRFSGWGVRRIEQELRYRSISTSNVRSAIDALEQELDIDEKLRDTLTAKYRSLPRDLEPRKVYERLMRFGLYRGYGYEDIQRIVRQLIGEHEYDEG